MNTLRHRITIREKILGAANAYNEPSEADKVVVRNLPCLVEQLRGRELENAKQVKATVTHRISWLCLDDIKPEHYGVPDFDTDTTLHFDAVTHDTRKHNYEALCTEKVT